MKALFIGSLTLLVLLVSSSAVNAQEAPVQNSCKAKAKQVAADAYRTCIADEKNVQLEQIKRNYQVKMLALKKYYEDQLKKLGANPDGTDKTDSKPEPVLPPENDVKADEAAKAVPAPDVENTELITEDSVIAESKEAEAQAIEEELKTELKAEAPAPAKIVEKALEPKVELKPAQPVKKSITKKSAPAKAKKVAALPAKKMSAGKLSSKSSPGKVPSKKMPLADDSVMDLPEPIPVRLKPSI